MNTISDFLSTDHHHCDELFAQAEDAVAAKDWSASTDSFQRFERAMAHHFAMEEDVMFPAFESHTGSPMGPTMVMRSEHQQMRGLFSEMAEAVARHDADAYLGQSETLLMLMQQHNLKEEQILYPMADRVLGQELGEVMGRMEAVGH